MSNDACLRLKWKVGLLTYLKAFRRLANKPVYKLICEVSHGILSSGSLKMSEIARALKEDIDLHHTSKRLSRMLIKHKLWNKIEDTVMSRMSRHLHDEMVLAIDPSIVCHPERLEKAFRPYQYCADPMAAKIR